jgi:hypothetical protein
LGSAAGLAVRSGFSYFKQWMKGPKG